MNIWKTITLGELIKELKKARPDAYIMYDFGGFVPNSIHSYRGFYDHLAIGYSEDFEVTVAKLLKQVVPAVGKWFEGYKGGSYKMSEDTPVWAAQYDRSNSTSITGIIDLDHKVIIATGFEDV